MFYPHLTRNILLLLKVNHRGKQGYIACMMDESDVTKLERRDDKEKKKIAENRGSSKLIK